MEQLRSYLNSLSTDAQKRFAEACDTTVGYLRNAIANGKKFGVELCIAIEKASDCLVCREDVRPDVDWAYLEKPRKRRKPK